MLNISNFNKNFKAQVLQKGNTLEVSDPSHNDCRCPGDFAYGVTVGQDQVTIRGFDRERGQVDLTLALSADEVTVSPPSNGLRGGRSMEMVVQSDSPMSPEQQQQFGVSVASSLIGIPLFFDPAKVGQQ